MSFLLRIIFCSLLLILLAPCGGEAEKISSASSPATSSGSLGEATRTGSPEISNSEHGDFAEELILPFRQDDPHILTRGYNNSSHRRYPGSDERFALDFAKPGCSGFRAEVIAPLSGRLTVSRSNGRGNNVLITRPDGLSCRLAHLDEILVEDGAMVSQGDPVGREGNTGGVQGNSCRRHPGTHIHLSCYRNGTGVPPEPISGYTGLNRLVSRTLVPQSQPGPQSPLTAALHPSPGSRLR